MRTVKLTPEVISAAAWDAGQESMVRNGRKVWNRADYNAAVKKSKELWAILAASTK